MDPVHLHLMVCHAPVIGQAISVVALAIAFFKKDASLRRWALALSLVTALTALPASWSGERSEDRASSLPGVSMDDIEAHEESAESALVMTLAAGGVAALGLVGGFLRERTIRAAVLAAALASLAAFGLLARTSQLGGAIRHPEIRSGPNP